MRSRIADAVAIDAHLVAVLAFAVVAALGGGEPALVRAELPGTSLELPRDGRVTQGDAPPAIDGPALSRKHYVDGLEVVATLSIVGASDDLAIDLTWSCDRRWTDVRMIARRDDRVALELLGQDVVRSIRCR